MGTKTKFYIVAADALPEDLHPVRPGQGGGEAGHGRPHGGSNDMKVGHIITFYAMLKDNPGVLSNVLSIFAGSGANILTINQSIPTNCCAAVTISAETSDMDQSLEELITTASTVEGVDKFEILAG